MKEDWSVTERIKKVEELSISGPEGHVKICPFLMELVRWIGEEQFNDFYYHHRRLFRIDMTEDEYNREVIEAL
jgi:hypothetical protein